MEFNKIYEKLKGGVKQHYPETLKDMVAKDGYNISKESMAAATDPKYASLATDLIDKAKMENGVFDIGPTVQLSMEMEDKDESFDGNALIYAVASAVDKKGTPMELIHMDYGHN